MRISPVSVIFCTLAGLSPALLAQQQPSGVHNFHQVNDHLYRGAQPTAEGFHSLAGLGIKTVIDLRSQSASERKVVEANGMRYVAVPLDGFLAPSDADVKRVLALIDDPASGPVFVHCRRGADRTGTIMAVYRITHDHWTNQKALDEAAANGMSRAEILMKHYVASYQAPAVVPTPAVAVIP